MVGVVAALVVVAAAMAVVSRQGSEPDVSLLNPLGNPAGWHAKHPSALTVRHKTQHSNMLSVVHVSCCNCDAGGSYNNQGGFQQRGGGGYGGGGYGGGY